MKTWHVRTLLGLIALFLILSPVPTLAHGEEKHPEPRQVVPGESTVSSTRPAGPRDREQLSQSSDPGASTSAEAPSPGSTSDSIDRAREVAHEAVRIKDVRAVWKLTAAGLILLGLTVAYWPGGKGEGS